MMVSGMTDDIIFQKSHLWAKSKKGLYCANEQFDDVIKCDLAVGMSYKNKVWQHIQLRANVLLLQTTMQIQLSC